VIIHAGIADFSTFSWVEMKKADPGKVGFEWSSWKALWVVGERTFHNRGEEWIVLPDTDSGHIFEIGD